MTAARRPDLETWMADQHIAWSYEPADLAGLDMAASLLHQARVEPLNGDVVDRYAADMARGDVFPAILVVRHPDGDVVIGGNHRVAGARRAGIATLPAYVIEAATDDQILLLTIEDNRRHGLPLTEPERLSLAVKLVASGRSQADAARVCGLHQVKVGRAVVIADADRRAARLAVAGWESLASSCRVALQAIDDSSVFHAAARLAIDHRLNAVTISALARACNAADSATAALALLGRERERLDEGTGSRAKGPGRPSQRVQLSGALGTIALLDAAKVLEQTTTQRERDELARQVTRAARVLQAVMVGVDRERRASTPREAVG